MVGSEHDEAIAELARLFQEHYDLRLPKFGSLKTDVEESDIDLFEEDAYLVGLASSFLGRRRRGTGRMKVDAILIDPTIDERLERAKLASDKDREILEQFKHYRESMLNLARALERATGVSVKFKGRERLVS